jgi:hypothetical protein
VDYVIRLAPLLIFSNCTMLCSLCSSIFKEKPIRHELSDVSRASCSFWSTPETIYLPGLEGCFACHATWKGWARLYSSDASSEARLESLHLELNLQLTNSSTEYSQLQIVLRPEPDARRTFIQLSLQLDRIASEGKNHELNFRDLVLTIMQ